MSERELVEEINFAITTKKQRTMKDLILDKKKYKSLFEEEEDE